MILKIFGRCPLISIPHYWETKMKDKLKQSGINCTVRTHMIEVFWMQKYRKMKSRIRHLDPMDFQHDQRYREIIQTGIFRIFEVFQNSSPDMATLSLIPKSSGKPSIKDLRPIRVSSVIGQLISASQIAFLEDG